MAAWPLSFNDRWCVCVSVCVNSTNSRLCLLKLKLACLRLKMVELCVRLSELAERTSAAWPTWAARLSRLSRDNLAARPSSFRKSMAHRKRHLSLLVPWPYTAAKTNMQAELAIACPIRQGDSGAVRLHARPKTIRQLIGRQAISNFQCQLRQAPPHDADLPFMLRC